MSPSDPRPNPDNDAPNDTTPFRSDSRRLTEPMRPLRLPEDTQPWLNWGSRERDEDEVANDDSEIIYLEETGNWALLLPEGAILHSHGTAGEDEDEEVFYECEPGQGLDGQALVRCSECGVTISEAQIESLIEDLDGDG